MNRIVHIGDPMPMPRARTQVMPSRGAARVGGASADQIRRGGWVFRPWVKHYTPKKAEQRKLAIARLWQWGGNPRYELGVPLAMQVVFVFARPAKHFGTGANASVIKPQYLHARPGKGGHKNAEGQLTGADLDNCLKLVKDALNDVAYADDGQIVEVAMDKFYVDQAGVAEPQTVVEIDVVKTAGVQLLAEVA